MPNAVQKKTKLDVLLVLGLVYFLSVKRKARKEETANIRYLGIKVHSDSFYIYTLSYVNGTSSFSTLSV